MAAICFGTYGVCVLAVLARSSSLDHPAAAVLALVVGAAALTPLIASSWSLATALSLLTWYVFAPMCVATLATIRREAGTRWAWITAGYLFALAYAAACVVYHATVWATS